MSQKTIVDVIKYHREYAERLKLAAQNAACMALIGVEDADFDATHFREAAQFHKELADSAEAAGAEKT